jgi:hypothetical protein
MFYLKKIVILIFSISYAFQAIAVDQSTAKQVAENAVKLAKVGQYIEAFHEIGWLLNEPSSKIRQYAEKILEDIPLIANSRVDSITSEELKVMLCNEGLGGRQSALHSIIQVQKFASIENVLTAKKRVDDTFSEDIYSSDTKCINLRNEFNISKKLKFTTQQEEIKKSNNAYLKIRELGNIDFCVNYGKARYGDEFPEFGSYDNILALFSSEAVRRKLRINLNILQKNLSIGMSECVAYATMGYPTGYNRMTDTSGQSIQLIYNNKLFSKNTYIDLKNGIIVSIFEAIY